MLCKWFLTRFVGISIEIIFRWRRWARVLLVPDCRASLLGMSAERRGHLWIAVVGHVISSSWELLTSVINRLLVVMVCLLWHHVVLLACHMNRLRLIIVAIKVSVCWYVLRMCNELMVLMEGREFHWWTSRGSRSTAEGWRVREGQWGRFWISSF